MPKLSRLFAISLLPALLTAAPSLAAEGGGGCPWMQEISVDLGGKTLTFGQDALKGSGEPANIDGYQLYPMLDQLKLRIVSPRGREWEVALTSLKAGKRCSAFYAGKPFLVSEDQHIYGGTVVTR
ncbi:hypothetical protein [Azospirillum sp. SYSU D00513]|uniref:hypothetical protein n=1 Tax=Azospirillum sp. SYSU D00513 TaxID=2812561 RepID=UPI001A95DD5E|nr:hypothetical protein [Azospirillum sp. SYSU D00513]